MDIADQLPEIKGGIRPPLIHTFCSIFEEAEGGVEFEIIRIDRGTPMYDPDFAIFRYDRLLIPMNWRRGVREVTENQAASITVFSFRYAFASSLIGCMESRMVPWRICIPQAPQPVTIWSASEEAISSNSRRPIFMDRS